MDELISRRAAIKAICEDGTWLERQGCTEITMAERKQRDADILEALPPVQPKRGKWVKISPANIYECSKCGKHVMTNDISAYDFCHGCGADMRGGLDGTD